jgi:hypothetical protein
MSFTKMTADVENITPLKDRPNEKPNGLSAAELRKKFDQAAIALKDFINRHIDELGAYTAAGNIGAKITVNGQRLDVNLQQAIDTAVEIGSSSGIQDGSVTNAKLRSAVDGANGAVSTDKINDGAVTAAKLGTDAVTTAKILNGNVTADKLGSNSVTEAKIAGGAVSADKINDGAVTATKIAGGAVSADKINDGAVTATKIAGGAVSAEYTGTLDAEDWSGDAAPYTQSIPVTGILSTDNPIADVAYSGTGSTDIARATNFSYIYRIATTDGFITAYAMQPPTVNLPIRLLCVRK